MIRRILKVLAYAIGLIGILIFSSIGPIDRSPIQDRAFYKTMSEKLDTLTLSAQSPGGDLQAGWARVNITPAGLMPMAGYSPRDKFETIHDSLYARILVVDNGGTAVAFINVDLLLFPTTLRARITEKLRSLPAPPFLYLSATHTHNGVGGWDDSIAGRIAFGSYHDEWVEKTAMDIVTAIGTMQLRPSALNYWEADASERVENRIDRENGETDGLIRGLKVERDDSTSAILFTFSAHPTSIEKESRMLSADYPAGVISRLEEEYDFGMFMAGMVGSHRFAWVPQTGFEFIELISSELVNEINAANVDSTINRADIGVLHIPIEFGAAQPRISKNWKIRDWVVGGLAWPLQGEATYVEIGNIIFIGLPCDFSGEIFKREGMAELARTAGKHVIITSFNGDYVGYITWDDHYEKSTAQEVNATNWVGPGYGDYFARIIESLIAIPAEKENVSTVR